jgi:hypothetical protein
MDSSLLDGGWRKVRITTLDGSNNIQTLTYSVNLDPVDPYLEVEYPEDGHTMYEDVIRVIGRATDDVRVSSLLVKIRDAEWEIIDKVDEDGSFETTIEFMSDPGDLELEITAVDNVGLLTSKIINITVLPLPDEIEPTLRLESPPDGMRIEKGDTITFRGTAYDNVELTKLELTAMGKTYNILNEIVGKTFSFSLDTSSWSTGEKKVTIRGEDGSGNTAMDSIDLVIYEEIPQFKDKEVPSITISTPVIEESIVIGSMITVTGKLFDDGPEIEMEFSFDRGETYEDVTSLLSRDWEFELEVSTLEIVEKLSLGPGALKLALDDYPLLFRIKDGAGRELFHEYSISLIDIEQPILYPAQVEMDLESNRVLIDLNVIDNTIIDRIEVTVLTPDGELFRKYSLENRDLRMENERWTGSFEVIGPFSPGTYSIMVTASDAWSNSDTTSADFTIEGEEEKGGVNPLVIIVPLLLALIIAPLLIFGLMRLFSRRNPLK